MRIRLAYLLRSLTSPILQADHLGEMPTAGKPVEENDTGLY